MKNRDKLSYHHFQRNSRKLLPLFWGTSKDCFRNPSKMRQNSKILTMPTYKIFPAVSSDTNLSTEPLTHLFTNSRSSGSQNPHCATATKTWAQTDFGTRSYSKTTLYSVKGVPTQLTYPRIDSSSLAQNAPDCCLSPKKSPKKVTRKYAEQMKLSQVCKFAQ
jgi:hypothetical protein